MKKLCFHLKSPSSLAISHGSYEYHLTYKVIMFSYIPGGGDSKRQRNFTELFNEVFNASELKFHISYGQYFREWLENHEPREIDSVKLQTDSVILFAFCTECAPSNSANIVKLINYRRQT